MDREIKARREYAKKFSFMSKPELNSFYDQAHLSSKVDEMAPGGKKCMLVGDSKFARVEAQCFEVWKTIRGELADACCLLAIEMLKIALKAKLKAFQRKPQESKQKQAFVAMGRRPISSEISEEDAKETSINRLKSCEKLSS